MGLNEVSMLPNIEPVFVVQFSGKYHFLSLRYAGNISGYSYGEDFLINNRTFYSDFFSKYNPDETFVFPHFNQITVTGFDLGPYSFSGGLFYPLIAIQGNDVFREVLSEKFSPLGIFKYTTEKTRTETVFSWIQLDSTLPSENNIKLILSEEMSNQVNLSSTSSSLLTQLESFDLDSGFLRINHEQNLDDALSVGISEVLFQGRYRERLSGQDFELHFDQLVSSVHMKQVFGDYVALKARLNYYIRNYRSEMSETSGQSSEKKLSFTLAIEFFL